MKRLVSIAIVLALCLTFTTTAFAAGKLDTTQENFITIDNWGIYSYAYARVENIGDKPVDYSAGLFEVYDANGDTITSSSYLHIFGDVLQPGEYAYVKSYVTVEDPYTAADVDDYMLTVTAKNGADKVVPRFPCETQWLPEYPVNQYRTENYMEATFTNTTEETLFDVSIVMALLSEDGNILYIEDKDFYSGVGIPAGSSVVVREEVSQAILDAWAAQGITPSSVDAYAYID